MSTQSGSDRSTAAPARTRRRTVTTVATGVLVAVTLSEVTLGLVGGIPARAVIGTAVAAPLDADAGAPTGGGTAPRPTGIPGGGITGNGIPGSGIRGGGIRGGGAAGSGVASGARGTTRSAADAEQAGVVDIVTVLDFGVGRAAGTGIVLTASGEILTNNHVIDGATTVTVTVTSTGVRYPAAVVGTDPTDDVAVLQLSGARGLTTAPLATAAQVAGLAVGDAVTAVGNAGGKGGTPSAATGSVVALGRSVTASDDNGADPERLTGLIEVDAAVEPGDSGGPLEADGEVVGIDTAAGTRGRTRTTTAVSTGFAIPITTATAIAARIVAGQEGGAIHRGHPAFLGVQVTRSGGDGATISGVLGGSPAAAAGMAAGDTITAIDATAIDDASALSTALSAHQPHDRVRVTWTGPAGDPHTATVTLTPGPAD